MSMSSAILDLEIRSIFIFWVISHAIARLITRALTSASSPVSSSRLSRFVRLHRGRRSSDGKLAFRLVSQIQQFEYRKRSF